MIPPELHTMAGFVGGLVLGSIVGILLMAVIAAGGREDAEKAAFDRGMRQERLRRTRAIAQLQRTDLVGDESTELGIIEA